MNLETKEFIREISSPKIGDIVTIITILIVIILLVLAHNRGNHPLYLVIRQSGKITKRYVLPVRKDIDLDGAIGTTRVRIDGYQARILSDPGPYQICVNQGWISEENSSLICLPSKITINLEGETIRYDSTSY